MNGTTFISPFIKQQFQKERKINALKQKNGFLQVNDLKSKTSMLKNPFFRKHTAKFDYAKSQKTLNVEHTKRV